MRNDIDQAKADSIEAQKSAKNANSKAGELQAHSEVLQNMLRREKDEATRIHKQTSALGEQTRVVKKENSDRAVQAALAAGMLASDSQKGEGKGGKKPGKMGKLKEYVSDDTTSGTSTDLSAVRSSSSSPATPSSQSTANKEFGENGPGSRSNRGGDDESKFGGKNDKLDNSASRSQRDFEAEAKRLREQLETLRSQQLDINKWLNSLTIELDNTTLKSGDYVINVQDSKTRVKITSPDKTPEALARKKAEEEARRKREADEAARRAAEEEARKKAFDEEAARRAAQDEAARKERAAEDEAARRKREAEDEAARKKREAEDGAARKKREAEDEAKRKKAAEEEAKRKKASDAEAAARRSAEEEAKRKKAAEEEAARRAGEGASRQRGADDDAAKGKGADGDEFFSDEMQGSIKENIKEVLGHLEIISKTVQDKASPSGTDDERIEKSS